MIARKGRTQRYKNMMLSLPADLELAECTSCHEGFVDERDASAMDDALETAYHEELRRRAIPLLDKLAKVLPQRRLETLLGLSVGHLSKIRSKEFPSAALVTELALLAADPAAGVHRLEKFWAKPARQPAPSR